MIWSNSTVQSPYIQCMFNQRRLLWNGLHQVQATCVSDSKLPCTLQIVKKKGPQGPFSLTHNQNPAILLTKDVNTVWLIKLNLKNSPMRWKTHWPKSMPLLIPMPRPKLARVVKSNDLALLWLQEDQCNEQWDAVDEQRTGPIYQQQTQTQKWRGCSPPTENCQTSALAWCDTQSRNKTAAQTRQTSCHGLW